ncbi:MAG: hypothetical protein ACI4CZ_09380 [Hominisplanchenecus sp.]
MKRKKRKGLDVHFQKDIREAVYERFQAVCEMDTDRRSEIIGGLEKSLDPTEEGYAILYFDKYGYPVFMISD